jgi:stalled ribosome alternative rescue factor ArfA
MADKRLSKDEAARQMAAADKRVKGISSIASSAIKRSKVLEVQKQYGTNTGNKQAVTSVDRALKSLSKSTEALAQGVKLITVETARGVKSITAGGAKAMGEYAKAIGEDIHINRQNFMVTTIGRFTPLVGFAVAKMMETSVFRNMIERMKQGLGRALYAVTSRFKNLALAGWDKSKELWSSFSDTVSGKRGAAKTRMAKARAVKKEKGSFGNVVYKKKEIESQIPHMASGGYVKKEGLAKVHAAEVVQPVDKITDTIVAIVNKKLDQARDFGREKEESGLVSFFKRSKKEDLFGMEKVTDKISNVFEIMTRRNLGLETRIMKRDKNNQKGLIKSFMSAYSEEAKQEELPLMERQVRATLELKKTISGQNNTWAAAWNKVMYEHPLFHGMTLVTKGLTSIITKPTKFLFKKRGRYASRLASSGTIFEKLADSSSQLFSLVGEKLDDIIHNTSITGEAASALANANKDVKKGNAGTKKAPGQRGWSVAGILGKLYYGTVVKGPAMTIGWLIKKLMPEGKIKDSLLEQRSWGKEWGKTKESLSNKYDKSKEFLWDKTKSGFSGAGRWLSDSRLGDAFRSGKSKQSIAAYSNYFINKGRKERFKRSISDSWDTIKDKTRDGKKSVGGFIKKIYETSKKQLKETIEAKAQNNKWMKKLVDGSGSVWKWIKMAFMWIISLPGKLAGLVSGGLVKAFTSAGVIAALVSSIGPAIAVALAGAAGLAAGKLINDNIIKPYVTDPLYKGADEKIKKGSEQRSLNDRLANRSVKEWHQGGRNKEEAQKGKTYTGIRSGITSVHATAREDFGLFSDYNFDRVTSTQQNYMNSHVGEYLQYGAPQVNSLRAKWNKENKFRSRRWIYGETFEKYGENREKAFLQYLKKNGKPLSSEELDKVTGISSQARAEAKRAKEPKNISKGVSNKLNNLQATLAEFAPVAAQMSGGSTTAYMMANWIRDYSSDNPNKLAQMADKIVGVGKDEWKAAGLDLATYELAEKIKKEKSNVSTIYNGLKDKVLNAGNKVYDKIDESTNIKAKVASAGLVISATMDNIENKLEKEGVTKSVTDTMSKGVTSAKVAWSSLKAGAIDFTNNAPGAIMTMSDNLVTSFMKIEGFFLEAYGDPKQFYKDTKEKVWGGIGRLELYLAGLYKHMTGGKTLDLGALASNVKENVQTKATNVYNTTVDNVSKQISKVRGTRIAEKRYKGRTYYFREQDFNSPTEFEAVDKMNYADLGRYLKIEESQRAPAYLSKSKVAELQAQDSININGLTDKLGENMSQLGSAVGKGMQNMNAAVTNVLTRNQNITTTNSSNTNVGGGNSNNRPVDSFTREMILGV